MNVQPCARCGYGVYPAEKINCIDQTWHKACFHCEVCKMMLTVNNFVSHEKKPYCQAHFNIMEDHCLDSQKKER
uniref:LIM and SH3 domain protein 1 n=1 Tax=Cyanistes caeruleus TaxID=156563 RepID=A0A8C0VE72_CYACU